MANVIRPASEWTNTSRRYGATALATAERVRRTPDVERLVRPLVVVTLDEVVELGPSAAGSAVGQAEWNRQFKDLGLNPNLSARSAGTSPTRQHEKISG